jgi:hypothetical protein
MLPRQFSFLAGTGAAPGDDPPVLPTPSPGSSSDLLPSTSALAPGDTVTDKQPVSNRPLRLLRHDGLADSDQLSQRPCRPQMCAAMVTEYDALIANDTWCLVP